MGEVWRELLGLQVRLGDLEFVGQEVVWERDDDDDLGGYFCTGFVGRFADGSEVDSDADGLDGWLCG